MSIIGTGRAQVATNGGTRDAALALFDSLPPVPLETLTGAWRGASFASGHPMDGLLERLGWYGKRFDSPEAVHPLVFARPDGTRFSLDPAHLPVGVLMRHAALFRSTLMRRAFDLLAQLRRTEKPCATLRMTEFRGVVSATMIYDALPIRDAFRQLDTGSVLGLMDLDGSAPFFFTLTPDKTNPPQ